MSLATDIKQKAQAWAEQGAVPGCEIKRVVWEAEESFISVDECGYLDESCRVPLIDRRKALASLREAAALFPGEISGDLFDLGLQHLPGGIKGKTSSGEFIAADCTLDDIMSAMAAMFLAALPPPPFTSTTPPKLIAMEMTIQAEFGDYL